MLCYELIIHFDFNPFLRILSTLSLMNARKKKKIRMYFLRKKKFISFRMKKKRRCLNDYRWKGQWLDLHAFSFIPSMNLGNSCLWNWCRGDPTSYQLLTCQYVTNHNVDKKLSSKEIALSDVYTQK